MSLADLTSPNRQDYTLLEQGVFPAPIIAVHLGSVTQPHPFTTEPKHDAA